MVGLNNARGIMLLARRGAIEVALFLSLSLSRSESAVDALSRVCLRRARSISVAPAGRSTNNNNGKPSECQIDVTDQRKRAFVNTRAIAARRKRVKSGRSSHRDSMRISYIIGAVTHLGIAVCAAW
jgi:hypothetical protein